MGDPLQPPALDRERTERLGPNLSAEINGLPVRIRNFIRDIETEADPAGTIQDFACAKENVEALTRKVLELEKERDEAILLLKPARPEDGLLPAIRDVLQQLVLGGAR